MKNILRTLIALSLLALPSAAQDCSSLSITTDSVPMELTQTVTIDVTGSVPNAPVYLVVGPRLGETTIPLRPMGTVVLGLQRPFSVRLLGQADDQGDLSLSLEIPNEIGLTLNAQSVGLMRTLPGDGVPTVSACTSNVVTFDL